MTTNQNSATAREDAYRLLAACYYPPTPALLEETCCETLASAMFALSPEASAYAMEAAKIAKGQSVEALAVEYARLFVGPFHLVAPPYGSCYVDDNKIVMGDSTAAVEGFYHACGLYIANDFHELPDHVAVELEFMSFLAFNQRHAEATGNSEESKRLVALQLEFLTKFLVPWLGPFTAAVINDGESSFNQAVARCTAAFVKSDKTALAVATHG